INDGQVLLVDVTDTTPKSSKVYLICIDGQLYIKRLINMVDKWVMRSDNSDKNTYPDIELSAENMSQIDIQGRVVWQAGTL
ncbi:helix-turn-helix transcriptional regulator, partial [Bacillus subtilis]|uniref:S24 family peptidase n=1 Tax=Bacillus subtilis TaxID=1423 RepID=UPI0035C0459E